MGLIVGLLLGVVLALPLLPLLRVTDPAFGRSAAGITLIGIAVFAIAFWERVDQFGEVPFRGVLEMAAGSAIAVAPIYLVAALIAALGARTQHR